MRASGSLRALLPGAGDYRDLRRTWRGDVVAGLTVGIVALPLALAFGVSAGVGAEAGLVTAIVAGLVAAVFGGSNVQVSGPTGAMVVILLPIVTQHGTAAVAVVSVLAGVIVVAAGALRWGRIVGGIPWPVIEGFTVGIGAIIFLQQVPSALGVEGGGHASNTLVAAIEAVAQAEAAEALPPLGAVVVVAVVMIALHRVNPRIPGSFVAIVVVAAGAVLTGVPLDAIGDLPRALPQPSIPGAPGVDVVDLIPAAFAVAALAAIESLLSARVAAGMSDTGPVHADRELVGQGLASIASGFFGGMPATGAIARTAVNVRSGARSRLSAVVHSLSLLVIVYVAAQVVAVVPLAALSGVLMVTAARMISVRAVRRVVSSTRSDAVVFAVTAAVTVSFDLMVAVGIGIAVAAFFALRALSRASGVHREELAGAPQPGDERIAVLRIDGSLFFGAAERVVERIGAHEGLDVVVLRLSQLHLVDSTGARTLAALVTVLEKRGITVLLKGVRPEHLPLLARAGAIDSLRHPRHLFDELEPAIAHARSHVSRAAGG